MFGRYSKGILPAHDLKLAIGFKKFPNILNQNPSNRIEDPVIDTIVDFTDSGLTEYVFPDNDGEPMTLQSSDITDTNTLVQVLGIDVDGNWKSTVYPLNGTTPVDIGSWRRINVVRSLFGVAHVGFVTVTGSGNEYIRSLARSQRSFAAVFSTPKNYASIVYTLSPTMTKGGGNVDASAEVFVYVQPRGGVRSLEALLGLSRRGNSNPRLENTIPESIPGEVDYVFRCRTDSTLINLFNRNTILMEPL